MARSGTSETEPRPLEGLTPFEQGDFHALSANCGADPQFNDRRLLARRRLGALGKVAAAQLAQETPGEGTGAGTGTGAGLELEVRTSLHHPHAFNGMRVKRLWVYLSRTKAEKKRLRKTLGAELAADLDAAFRNAYLCCAIEADAVEVSLRIHADAWFDGQNLVHRVRSEGLRSWLGHLNALGGYRLQLADWKGEWSCGSLEPEQLEEFLGYYKPGEHSLSVELRHWPAPDPVALVEVLARLVPLYRYTAWSKESDFLFG